MNPRLALMLLAAAMVNGQDSPFQAWAKKKAAAIADRVVTAADAGSDSTAASAPTLDSASSSVVDRSNPGEFFNAALNLAGVNGRPAAGAQTGSVTVTAYSVVAALQHQSLVDPELYRRNRFLRRAAFTIGTSASDLIKNGTETPGALYGFRFRLLEGPDLFSRVQGGGTLRETVLDGLQRRLNENNSFSRLNALMFPLAVRIAADAAPTEAQFEQAYSAAPASTRAEIDRLIRAWVDEDAQLAATVVDLRAHLQRPRQLTVAYFTNQRTDGGADDHRLELIYDHGLHKRVDWTTNGGFEYRNVINVGGDRKGGRLASEAKIRLFESSAPGDEAEQWVTLDMGGEWKAMTGTKAYLKSQVRLTIPLAGGVSLPIAWSYESRPLLTPTLQANDSFRRFRFGIEFDPAKIGGLVK